MRFIHTSDWHLGRSFGPVSLHDDQVAFCDWFVDLARTEAVDLVVIAGDLYDRAIAPTESIELFRDTVGRLLAAGVVVAAITGNHDSADRVAAYDTMLDGAGFHLRGGYQRVGEVLTVDFDDGPLDLVLLPYLAPRLAADDYGVDTDTTEVPDEVEVAQQRRRGRTHASVLSVATAAARAALVSPRSVAVAHAFVTGGTTSESERAFVGGTGDVPVTVFDGFSYVALGHLHRPQDVSRGDGAPAGAVRYSGTPLAYSFSEDHPKSVTLVDMDPAGTIGRRIVDVPVGRPVVRLEGTIDELLGDPRHDAVTDHFVQATLTDRETVIDAKARLSVRFPHVVTIVQRASGVSDQIPDAPADASRRDPAEIMAAFWAEAEGAPPDAEIEALLTEALTGALDEVRGGVS